jgi:hypothetical protein
LLLEGSRFRKVRREDMKTADIQQAAPTELDIIRTTIETKVSKMVRVSVVDPGAAYMIDLRFFDKLFFFRLARQFVHSGHFVYYEWNSRR